MIDQINITNPQGLRLAAMLQKPQGAGLFPVVILLHGFTGYKEEEHYVTLADELEKLGIASIRFDASGFGESEGSIQDDYRFTNYLSDTEAVYEHLKSQKFVDESKIGVCGQSMGGMMAVVFASTHSELKAVCAVSAPDQFGTEDEMAQHIEKWQSEGQITLESSKMGRIIIPYSFVEDIQQYDTTKYAARLRSPLLVVLGLADTTVLPKQTCRVFRSAPESRQLVELEGVDHFYKRDPKKLEQVNEVITHFFEKELL